MDIHINNAKQWNHSRDDNRRDTFHADIFPTLWQKIYDKISDRYNNEMSRKRECVTMNHLNCVYRNDLRLVFFKDWNSIHIHMYIGYWFYLLIFQFREIFVPSEIGTSVTNTCLFVLLHNLSAMHFASGFLVSFVYIR